jgi:hypothetical protein
MARIIGFRDASDGDWYKIHPVQQDEDIPLPAVTDISIQNLDSSNDIYVSGSQDWDQVGMQIKPGQIVSFEGLSASMELWVNDDGSDCEMAVTKIER